MYWAFQVDRSAASSLIINREDEKVTFMKENENVCSHKITKIKVNCLRNAKLLKNNDDEN